jgi:hypothetical protein
MRKIYSIVLLFLISTSAFAFLPHEFNGLVGYTILGTKQITGWFDQNGKKGDSFEGCDYGRTIVLDNDKILVCQNFHFHFAFRPTALILSDGHHYKMIVDDHIYDMSRG